MLDRTDRKPASRGSTDLVLVKQTRTASRRGYDKGDETSLPAIYLSELGPRRVLTKIKWFASTVIVALSGLAIIGIVLFTSLGIDDGSGVIGSMRRSGREAMKPKQSGPLATDKPVVVALKTSRVAVSSKGIATKNLILEQVMQKRGTRDFITNKPYVKLTASLATDRPEDNVVIPAFNPLDLFGNDTPIAKKEQAGGELTTDPRVSVKFIEVSGGFLPREDNQTLSNEDIEKLVAEADATYATSEAGALDAEAEALEEAIAAPPPLKAEKNTTILYKKSDDDDAEESFDTRSITAKGGETIESVLKGQGVDTAQAGQVAEALAKITKTKRLRWGEEVRVALAPSTVEEGSLDVAKLTIVYQSNPIATIARDGDGDFAPSAGPVVLDTPADDGGNERSTIYVSTYRAAFSQQLPKDFIFKFLKIHAYDADFKTRVKAGDGFELFYDVTQDEAGIEKPNEMLYAAFTIAGETRGYYRFRTPDGAVDYYEEKGSNSKKFLMKMPVKAGRLTSTFGYRRHPLSGVMKPHTGIDWAGPIGTPIMAAGNGTIEVAGREGGYGNYVRIRHANGYKTAYGHMVRFAEGVSKGAKVRQGQVIGYIGNTGFSTGAHLHYEVSVNNKFTNPLSIKVPRSRQLTGRLLTEFRREKSRIDDLMKRPVVKTSTTSVERAVVARSPS